MRVSALSLRNGSIKLRVSELVSITLQVFFRHYLAQISLDFPAVEKMRHYLPIITYAQASYERQRQETTHFDENDKKYRLCCWHVKIWTLVIGLITLISLLIQLFSTVSSYVREKEQGGAYASFILGGMIFGIIMMVIGIFLVMLLIQGVRKIKPTWLIPFMFWQVSLSAIL